MIKTFALAISLLLSLPLFSVETSAENSLTGTSYTPPATGVVIQKIMPDSAAEKSGLQIGDIITAYGMTPITTQEQLLAAIEQHKENTTIVVQRVGNPQTISVPPGKLGMTIIAVKQGEKLSLPPATEVKLDTTRYENQPLDEWYAFFIDGKQVGAEHNMILRRDNKLTVTVEVAFDGGEQWGLNHMYEIGQLDCTNNIPQLISMTHEGPLWDLRSAGQWRDTHLWELTITGKNEDGTSFSEVTNNSISGTLINDYSVASLTTCMPSKPGSCVYLRRVIMNSAQPLPWAALLVVGPEIIEITGKKIDCVRIENRTLFALNWVAWLRDGRIEKIDYSGGSGQTFGIRSTYKEAIKGLNPEIKLKSVSVVP